MPKWSFFSIQVFSALLKEAGPPLILTELREGLVFLRRFHSRFLYQNLPSDSRYFILFVFQYFKKIMAPTPLFIGQFILKMALKITFFNFEENHNFSLLD